MQIRRRRRLKFENIESRYLLTAATTVYGQVHVEVNWDAKLTREIGDTSIVDVVSNTDGAFLNGVVARQSKFKIIELPMNDIAEIRDTWTNQWDANHDLLFLGSNALQPFVDMRSQLGNQRLFETPAFDFDLDVAEEVTTNAEFHVTTPSPPLTNQETITLDSAGARNIVTADPPRVEITTPPTVVESMVTQSPPVTTPPIVSPPSVEIPATGLPLVQDANPPTLEPSHQIDLDFVSKFQSESTTLEPLQGHTSNYDLESSFEITTPQIPSTPDDTSWFEPTSVSLSPSEPTHVTTTSVAETSELTPFFELSESILNEAISTSTPLDIEPPTIVNIPNSSPSRDATQSPLNQQSSENPAVTTKSDTTSSDPAISSEIPQQSLMNVADYMDVAHDMTNKVMGVSDKSIEMPRDTDDLIDAEFADRESSEVLRIPAGTDEEFIDVGEISVATDQAMYIPTWFDVAEFGETSSGPQVVPAYEVGAYSVSRPIEFDQTTSTEEPAENAAVQALPVSDTKSASTGRITTQYVAATTGSEHLVMPAASEGSSMELIATSIVTLASPSIKNASVDGDRVTEVESENDGTRYGTMAQATLIAICGATLFYTRETDRRSKRAEFDRDVDREITQIV